MITQSNVGINQPNPKYRGFHVAQAAHNIPKEQRSIIVAKHHPSRVAAMDEELVALATNHAWTLNPY